MKKLLCILLSVPLIVSSCAKADVNDRIILGSSTELTGDFRFPGYGGASAGAADQDIAALTTGYAVMETDPSGEYVWNETVVKTHTEEEIVQPDGSRNYRITVELNEGLTFSDGTPVTADNYLAYLLAFSTPVARSAGATGMAGQAYTGYADFFNYAGDGVRMNPEAPASREFTGLRRLSEYSFSLEVDGAAGYYPYFYTASYAAVTPYDLGLLLGEGVSVRDDGNGCYLDGAWYEQTSSGFSESLMFKKAEHMKKARYDTETYPYSGPYTIASWDEGTREAVLKLNDAFLGNFEGQKPTVRTVVCTRTVTETQFDQLTSGAVDILSGITGGDETKAALRLVGKGFRENHYLRAGYGKIQFDCDFGPTLFPEVRQAAATLLDRSAFAATFTGGYGKVVNGPYSEESWMYHAAGDEFEKSLNRYDYSVAGARQLLEQGGWIYNSRGEAYMEGADGIDRVRYKRVTREELEQLTTEEGAEATIAYRSVSNTDNTVYRTVETGGAYYVPLVLNWFSTENNAVSDLLSAMLMNGAGTAACGMVIRQSSGDFNAMLGELRRDPSYGYSGTMTYNMYNLATGFTSPVYDYSFQWSHDPAYSGFSSARLYDPYDRIFSYYAEDGTHERLSYEEALRRSDGKLGMDYLSMAMVYDADTEEEYVRWWTAYIRRWNELLPEIPLYCNYYYDIYNEKIQDYRTSPYWGAAEAILYCRG